MKPTVVLLWFEEGLLGLLEYSLTIAYYPTIAVTTAADALECVERQVDRGIVMMDNYAVSKEARDFLKELGSRPDLRGQIKVIGLSASDPRTREEGEQFPEIDTCMPLPFTVDQLINEVEATTRQLLNEM